jgi:hypothetical protein
MEALKEHRRDEVIASVGTMREELERKAERDLPGAQRSFRALTDSTLAPEVGQAKAAEIVQAFNERTTFTHLARQLDQARVSGDAQQVRDALTQINDPAYVSLDPDRKRMLLHQGEGEIERINLRAQAAQDRRLAKVGRALDGAMKLTLAGMPPNAEQLAPLVSAAKGTEHEGVAADLIDSVGFVERLKALPPEQMNAAVLGLEREVRKSPTLKGKQWLDMARELQTRTKDQVMHDPQAFVAAQGLDSSWQPIDWTDQAKIAQQLDARRSVALGMKRQYGSPEFLLTREEAGSASSACRRSSTCSARSAPQCPIALPTRRSWSRSRQTIR